MTTNGLDNIVKKLIEAMPNGLAVYMERDGQAEAVMVSDGLCSHLGMVREEALDFLNRGLFEQVHPDYLEGLNGMIQYFLTGKEAEQTPFENVLQVRLGDDTEYSRVLVRENVMTVNGIHLAMVNFEILMKDPGIITEDSVNTMKELYDALTGLSNMTRFLKISGRKRREMLEDGYDGCVVYFDMNGMKAFNSKYGTREGDKLLKIFANVLRSHFSNECAARLGEDHFAAIGRSDTMENEIRWILAEMANANDGKTLPVKAGIYQFGSDPEINSPIDALDRAKIACDRGKSTYGSIMTWYDREMSENYMLQNYLLEHLDQALEKEWIQVFVQPVVRVLSGCLCGMEALVRWMDPEHGLIPPSDFIPVLEKNGQSYKLDTYVVKKVAAFLGSQLKKDLNTPVVPISVNFSRSDFESVDPVEIVVNALDENNVTRNLINVEITETALMKDAEEMKNAIERFHQEGMEVWMDDYGSGYSSLNVLKDFDFDEIKIDMAFLRELNEKSMSIVTSTVQMAKSLGIHTLAEGVETEEQLEFLKSIGCEKIQGYYYGRPIPISEAVEHFNNNDLEIETREMAGFYNRAGLVDVVSDRPVALFFDDGSEFRSLFENEPYRQMLRKMELTGENAIEKSMNTVTSPLGHRFRDLADQAESSGIEEKMIFVVNDKYTRFSFQSISRCRRGNMLFARMDNAVVGAEYEQTSMLDAVLRNIYTIYDSVYILDFENDKRTVVLSNLPAERSGDQITGIREFYNNYGSVRSIFPDDIDRLRRFQDIDSLRERLRNSSAGFVSDVFRVRQSDGAYKWTEFLAILLPDSGGNRLMISIRPAEYQTPVEQLYKQDQVRSSTSENSQDYVRLWETLMKGSDIKFFWKDREQRFAGGNRAFMDFCGFTEKDDFVGLRDEELGWHKESPEFRECESRVLERGESFFDIQMQNVTRGVLSKIAVSEFPVYANGRISGLLGYFRDGTTDLDPTMYGNRKAIVDPVTGLMNIRGLMVALIELDDNMTLNDEQYFLVILDVPAYGDIHFEHGDKAARALIRKVSKKVVATFERNAAIARTRGSRFVIALTEMKRDKVYEMVKQCASDIRTIQRVNGIECNLKVDYGIAVSSEADSVQAVVTLADNRLEMSRQDNNAEIGMDSSEIADLFRGKEQTTPLDSFRDIPIPYVIAQPVMNEDETEMIDLILLFANNKFCELSGVDLSEMLGRRYVETFPEASAKWLSMGYRAARGEWISGNDYSYTLKHWTSFIMSPSSMPGRFIIMFTSLEDDMRENDILRENMETDRTVIGAAKVLSGGLSYRSSVETVLEMVGKRISADRLYIFEADGWTISSTFEWTAPGVPGGVRNHQRDDYRLMMPLEEKIRKESSLVCLDVESIRYSNSFIYNFFKEVGIRNYILTPLYEGKKLIGYLGADNFNADNLTEVRRLMETISFFISSKILTNRLLERLDRVGNHDELTGVGNRNAMNILLDEITSVKEKSSVGVIYADLNGLKEVNDSRGHAAGDRMLREATEILHNFCRTKNIFRVGGDEFVVLMPDITRESFGQIRSRMIEHLGEASDSMLALGFDWCENSSRLEIAMKRADQKMYYDKQEYYKKHDRRNSSRRD